MTTLGTIAIAYVAPAWVLLLIHWSVESAKIDSKKQPGAYARGLAIAVLWPLMLVTHAYDGWRMVQADRRATLEKQDRIRKARIERDYKEAIQRLESDQ